MIAARRLSQIVFFFGFLYIIWFTKYPLKGFLNPSLYFNLDPFVIFLTALAERVFLAGIIYSLFTLAVTLIFGRVFCGWFCPLGSLQDFWAYVPKAFGRKFKEAKPSKNVLVKYYILAAVFVPAVFGVQYAWAIDPFAIFVRVFSFNIFPWFNGLIDGAFIMVLKSQENPGFTENVYYWFKDNIIALNSPVFPQTAAVLAVFLGILALASYKRRFWCRYLCPLGATLTLAARFSLLNRTAGKCRDNCALCRSTCRMNAINSDNSYIKQECVLCMDCTAKCPGANSKFVFGGPSKQKAVHSGSGGEKGISRAQFLAYLSGGLAFLSGRRLFAAEGAVSRALVLRPPAALSEREFIQRCIRCGNCMKVCPTNVLQPALLETGFNGVWTPKMGTDIGYCEYECDLCGKVCPTGAIALLTKEEKIRTKIGLAEINPDTCLPWAEGTECIVCEEHCPVADKAIKTVERMGRKGKIVKYPSVDPALCVGCAICEFKCPVKPRAITVRPL